MQQDWQLQYFVGTLQNIYEEIFHILFGAVALRQKSYTANIVKGHSRSSFNKPANIQAGSEWSWWG